MMCVPYSHGAFLDNRIGPEVPVTIFSVAKPAADFGHAIKIISTCAGMTVILYTCKVMNI
jgi:hypothetical protein